MNKEAAKELKKNCTVMDANLKKTTPLEFVFVIEDDIFNKPYKSIKVYCDKTYVKVYGEEYEAGEDFGFYITPSFFGAGRDNISSTAKYEGTVLPDYNLVENVPTGLKVTGYVLTTKDGKIDYAAGDPAKPGVRYYVRVAVFRVYLIIFYSRFLRLFIICKFLNFKRGVWLL